MAAALLVTLAVGSSVGFVWNSMLWVMHWNLVAKHGYNPDIYGAWSTGGKPRHPARLRRDDVHRWTARRWRRPASFVPVQTLGSRTLEADGNQFSFNSKTERAWAGRAGS